MRIVNLTPHALHVYDYHRYERELSQRRRVLTVPPSGTVARCVQTEEVIRDAFPVEEWRDDLRSGRSEEGEHASGYRRVKIAITRSRYGAVEGLPEPQPETIYIVSAMVMNAVQRDDVLCPGPAVRDAEGRVVGCMGLSRV